MCHALLQIMTLAEVLSSSSFAKMGSSKLSNGQTLHQQGVSLLLFPLIFYLIYWVRTEALLRIFNDKTNLLLVEVEEVESQTEELLAGEVHASL